MLLKAEPCHLLLEEGEIGDFNMGDCVVGVVVVEAMTCMGAT